MYLYPKAAVIQNSYPLFNAYSHCLYPYPVPWPYPVPVPTPTVGNHSNTVPIPTTHHPSLVPLLTPMLNACTHLHCCIHTQHLHHNTVLFSHLILVQIPTSTCANVQSLCRCLHTPNPCAYSHPLCVYLPNTCTKVHDLCSYTRPVSLHKTCAHV